MENSAGVSGSASGFVVVRGPQSVQPLEMEEQRAEQLHAVRRRAAAVRRVGAGQAGDRHLPAPPGAQLPVGAGGAGPGLRLPLRRLPQGPADQGTEDRRRAQHFDREHSNVAARHRV